MITLDLPDHSDKPPLSETNPMNCYNCHHKQVNYDDGSWCYMFKDEPIERCYQFNPQIPWTELFRVS